MTKPQTLDELYSRFDGMHVEGGWHRRFPALWPEPEKNFVPYVWHYADVHPVLDAAGDLISTEFAERRNLTMRNPIEGNKYATVRTMVAAYQMVKPGEIAKAHRHTPNALRLILDGRGANTTVNGKRVDMNPGDVMLTPNWAWHAHENAGTEDCYWLDFLDVPTVHLTESMFYERHPDGLERDVEDLETAPIAFRWADSVAGLDASTDTANGMCAAQFELGDPALETMRLYMQRLNPGPTPTMQTTANSLYAVIEGEGQSVIDGEVYPWARGDVIAVPSWRAFRHEPKGSAVMLRVTDKPIFEKFGWLRETFA
ncbi:MAG: cupin domain-containing protein [Rhodobacter sp.]|nr:cupin domain-containing protein [Paracoccaceae bacterium]MCC0077306.1 cupin domain-containing protein [Rhodobacter sp.]